MSLDRDELAARCLAALLSRPDATESSEVLAAKALSRADALLSRLRPSAPDAPATEPRRTVGAVVRTRTCAKFVVVAPDRTRRIDLTPIGDPRLDGPPLYDTDEFVRWATREECERHGIPYIARPLPGAPVAAPSLPEWVRWKASEMFPDVPRRVLRWVDGCPVVGRMSTRNSNDGPDESLESKPIPSGGWEPCAAPSPAPAATPAAWVPSVGDVVHYVTDEPGQYDRVVVAVDALGQTTMRGVKWPEMVTFGTAASGLYRFLRRATSAERAAAGLPVDESATECDEDAERKAAWTRWKMAENDGFKSGDWNPYLAGWLARARLAAPTSKPVDRVALADALHIAWWWREKTTATPWGEIHPDSQADWLRAADAAIAFLNGGSK